MSELKMIPLKDIRENPVALRSVNRQTEQYIGLVDSIRARGVLNPINVREVRGDNGKTLYGLVDGLHRYTAAGDAGLSEIPAQVVNLSDAEVLEAQIIGNVHKIETKPAQYADQLQRILSQNPTLTSLELAKKLAKSPKWLSDRLSLTKLDSKIQPLVDEGKLNLSNAYVLAKLPPEEQPNWLERAMTDTPQIFVPAVGQRVKEIRDAKRQGRTPGQVVFQPTAHLRKKTELEEEMAKPSKGPQLVKENKLKTPEEAFAFAIKWVLHMDPASQDAQRAQDDKRKADEERRKEERKKERLEQQAAEARAKLKELQPTS